jgi:hypothetical protein
MSLCDWSWDVCSSDLIWPSHSGVIWPYRYSILKNMAISFRCYLAVLVQYPEHYGHLIQVLSGRTGTVSWTIRPSHSGVIWPYRYTILNNTAISFRRKIWSTQQAVTIFLSKSNNTTKGLLKIFHMFLRIPKLREAYLFTLLRRCSNAFIPIHKYLPPYDCKNKFRASKQNLHHKWLRL